MTAAVDLSARLAEILADPSFEPELLARALADIDDTPRTLAESDERLERWKQRRADMGIAPAKRAPLTKPPRADRFDCLAFGASCRHTLMVDGTGIATPLPCGECSPCQEWRVFKIMVRYRHSIGDYQTIIKAVGFRDVDAARKWASEQGRRCSHSRMTLLCRGADYWWQYIMIYANPLNSDEIKLTNRALSILPSRCSVETRTVAPSELLTLVPRDACAEGTETNPATGKPIRRRTCVFTGWPDYEEEPSDCAQNDGVVETGILNPQREPTPLPGWAKALELLPFEERSARHAEYWCDVAALDDYVGPSWLPRKAREYLNGKALWRECYRPVLWLMDAENKAPPTVCQGCGRPAQLTPKGLCIRCALR